LAAGATLPLMPPATVSSGSTAHICIFSAPRSGSTWLAKLFDSHPDVLYLHEPELFNRGLDFLPYWLNGSPDEIYIAAARDYFYRLIGLRSSRVIGRTPFFRKNYRSTSSELVRQGLIGAVKLLESLGLERATRNFAIPDFRDPDKLIVPVVKSVSALGRARILIEAMGDELRPILLIRHPCAVVASIRRGVALGVMGPQSELGQLLETGSAKGLGIDPHSFTTSDEVDLIAWNWLLANAEAYQAVKTTGGTMVIYESLVSGGADAAAKLFTQVGLRWTDETARFLKDSRSRNGGYYSVYRDPSQAINGWKLELDSAIVARIRKISLQHPVGQLFF
jgi:hypothetical protein